MTNRNNLYDTLFTDDDELDVGMLAINEMYGHLNFDEMSNYFSLSNYNVKFPSDNASTLSVIHFNIRSVETNITHLEALLSNLQQSPDIIALTETWLDESNMEKYILDGYKSFHVVREPKKRGGVSIHVRDTLMCDKISEFSYINNLIEICTIVVSINDQKYVIAAIYRPSTKYEKIKEFRKELTPILKSQLFKKSNSFVIGDLNIDLLIHGQHQETNEYLNLLQTYNYMPVITRPTRFPQGRQLGTPSLLDHLFINFSPASTAGILHYDITDHLPIFLNLHLPKPIETSYSIKFRIFNEENETKFTRKLAYTLWEEILIDPDVNNNFDLFYSTFERLYNECFPIKTKIISAKRFQSPWLSSGLINSIKNKNKMFKKFKIGMISEQCYKTYKNRLLNILRMAKKNYYTQLFNNFRTNSRKLWQAINSLNGKNSSKTKIENLIIHGDVLKNPTEISEAFNNYFVNVGSDLERNLPNSSTDPLSYLPNRNPSNMPVPLASITDISTAIKSLKSKSCRVDDFSPVILKRNCHLIASPLTDLFNQSVLQGKFPTKLKIAKVLPLYKKGSKCDLNNYRPISLLNIFSKVFEKIMKKKLIDFIDSCKILSPHQYGFQKGINTEDALTQFSKNIYRQLDNSNTVLSIFIDFSKAFDTVPHNILLRKLEHYGIRGSVHRWFLDYLSHRQQSTCFENSVSSSKRTTLGVPQGSVLGPLLFLLFINDLPNVSKLLSTILFADDATLPVCGKKPELLIRIANNELYKFYLWCVSNRLTVNTLKTFFVLFSNRCTGTVLPPLVIKSNYNYDPIVQVDSIKFLGVFYDSNMSFKSHINYLSLRLSRIAALLYRVKSFVPDFVLKTIYQAHFMSIISYCNLIWSNTYSSHLDPIIKLQKRVIRLITNSDYLAHTYPLFKQLKLLNIMNFRKYNLAIYFFKNRATLLPHLRHHHHYHTRNRNRPIPEHHHRTIFEKSFVYQAPIIWNELLNHNPNFADINSLNLFKRRTKQYLLSI